ncbi:MAG: aminodeoxychorismate/anthranilate synthase component II [Spirochaetes bacterium]|nr:aminodeoxychorismate/anthranilate synthase component II [Spirochaetota bacterium]
MFLLIDNYDSFTYNLKALFHECGASVDVVKNDEFRPAEGYEGIILSPGPSTPANSGTTLRYLDEFLGRTPIFGVCLGMQAIAHVLGYTVAPARTVMHGKVDRIGVTAPSILFRGIPDSFSAVRYHSLAVEIEERYVTSRSRGDGTVMSIEDPGALLFGVQFHPESIMSEFGQRIVRNFLEYAASRVQPRVATR